jgi:hypothetical protein
MHKLWRGINDHPSFCRRSRFQPAQPRRVHCRLGP